MGTTTTVEVDARAYWVNSGIDLQAGDAVSIKASGACTSAPGRTADANGVPGLQGKDSYVLPKEAQGALIGYIGDMPPSGENVSGAFVVGTSKSWRSSTAGTLWFTINDDVTNKYGQGYEDNIGRFSVTITVG